MVRGRIGGTGTPFNLGEMTATRCSLRLEAGGVGHAHVQGRNKAHALRAAAAMPCCRARRQQRCAARRFCNLWRSEEAARRVAKAERAAATKVEFFTLVRGEDQ